MGHSLISQPAATGRGCGARRSRGISPFADARPSGPVRLASASGRGRGAGPVRARGARAWAVLCAASFDSRPCGRATPSGSAGIGAAWRAPAGATTTGELSGAPIVVGHRTPGSRALRRPGSARGPRGSGVPNLPATLRPDRWLCLPGPAFADVRRPPRTLGSGPGRPLATLGSGPARPLATLGSGSARPPRALGSPARTNWDGPSGRATVRRAIASSSTLLRAEGRALPNPA